MNQKKYYLTYTIIFIVVAMAAFSWFYLSGRVLMFGDAWDQHYKAYMYYGRYLRELFSSVISGTGIPQYDFYIGEGADVITTLNHYCLGDPFAILSAAVPMRYMHIYYCLMIVARLYFAGIAFSVLCFETGRRLPMANLAGAFSYVFCYWTFMNVCRHPFFLNPLIYLPLLIAGAERVIQKRGGGTLLVLATFVSAISNVYFFYMLAIMTAIYVFTRLALSREHTVSEKLMAIGRIAVLALWGVLLSAAILLPVAYSLIFNARISADNAIPLLYPAAYYKALPAFFLKSGSPAKAGTYLCMGYAAPVFAACCILFRRKTKNRQLKLLFLMGVAAMCIPALGLVSNGFSYVSNRWSFAFALLCSYILTAMFPDLVKLNKKDLSFILLCTFAYTLVCVITDRSGTEELYFAIALMLFMLLWLLYSDRRRAKELGILAAVLLAVTAKAYWNFSPDHGDLSGESISLQEISEYFDESEASAVREVASNAGTYSPFTRYSGDSETVIPNSNMIFRMASPHFYFSSSNPNVVDFRRALCLNDFKSFKYTGYDDRSILMALSGVRYYITGEDAKEGCIPQGFEHFVTYDAGAAKTEAALRALSDELSTSELSENQKGMIKDKTEKFYEIYENRNALPGMYTYDSYVPRSEWDTLNCVQKQEVMLTGAVLEDTPESLERSGIDTESTELPFEIEAGTNVFPSDKGFVVTKDGAVAKLKFKKEAAGELGLYFGNLTFRTTDIWDLYNSEDDSIDPERLYGKTLYSLLSADRQREYRLAKKNSYPATETSIRVSSPDVNRTLYYATPYKFSYDGKHDYLLNFGCGDADELELCFDSAGVYETDSLKLYNTPVEDLGEKIGALKENAPEEINIGVNTVSARVRADKPGLLLIALPYTGGFSATVDGKKQEVLKANLMYLGLELSAGEHEVSLTYETPLLKEGALISGAAFLLSIIFSVICIVRKRCARKIKAA